VRNLIRKIKRSSKEKKRQIRFILIGYSLYGGLSIAFAFVLPLFGFSGLIDADVPESLIFVAFTAYAIVHYKWMNVKVIAVQLLSLLIVSMSLINIFNSSSFQEEIFNLISFLILLTLSYLLVKSVLSEVKRKEELEIANAKLRQLDEAKSEFVSVASHQLRTPLTTINGFLSMIFEGSFGEIPAKMQPPLGMIRDANNRLLSLVDDLLNVSRIESGRMKFEFKEEKIEGLLKELYESFFLLAKNKGLYFDLVLPDSSLPLVMVDRAKLREAVSNLFDNAIKYTSKGGVKISAQEKDGKVRVIVADTGIGVEKSELEVVFEKFSRGTSQKRLTSKGVGLGLYFAKKIVEANSGMMWIESKGAGRGSRFIIELPINA